MASASLSPATELEQRLESLLAARTAGRRDYAVFDWDNTCIVHDCQENLFFWMIEHLAFKISPEHFAATLHRELPLLALTSACRNSAGRSVTLESLCRDLDDDYDFLRSPQCPKDFRATPQFLDFRVKLLYLYEAITLSYGSAIAYKWNIYFFSGFSAAELNGLAVTSHQHFLREPLETRHFISPEELPGQSGVVSVSLNHGLRISDEILRLIDILRQHQIDIFVNTASLEDVVAAFACDPRFGFGLPRNQIFGLRMELEAGRFAPFYQHDWPMNWGPGKTEMIRRQIIAERGFGPIFVAGDSDGDYDMLRDFPDTLLGLIIRRGKGKIQELRGERYWLQKRDPVSGAWLDSHPMAERVTATPAALEFIAFLRAKHGPLMFHQSGGCCDGSAANCFLLGEFLTGPADVLLGEIGGTPFFIGARQYEAWKHTQIIIDVVPGHGGAFSLDGPEGKTFLSRSRVFTAEELAEFGLSGEVPPCLMT